MNLLNLILAIIVVLIVWTVLSRLMERQESSIVVDGKVRVALLNDGCEVAVPHTFEFSTPGKYYLPGVGVRDVKDVVERSSTHGLLGPGAETPQLPTTPILTPLLDIGGEVARPVVDLARIGADVVAFPDELAADLQRLRQDVTTLPADLTTFGRQELRDVQDVTTGPGPLTPLNIIQL